MSRLVLVICILMHTVIFLSSFGACAEEKNANNTGKNAVSQNELSLEKAVDILLRNNLMLNSAKYDVIMSDTDYRYYQKKYSPLLGIEGGYSRQHLPVSGTTELNGNKSWEWQTSASVSKAFTTGTNISAGVKERYYDSNDQILEFNGNIIKQNDPAFHNPVFFVSLQQELLKNAFGYSERIQGKVLNNITDIRRREITNQLSVLIAEALIDYWDVTVRKSAADNAKMELESSMSVRKIIATNTRYGLMDVYGLHQFNAVVAASETKLEIARQNYRESLRKLLRTLNMPPETQITGVTNLVDKMPELNIEISLKAAFDKRADYRNVLAEIDNSRMSLKIYENDALPSVIMDMNLNTQGQREQYSHAMKDAAKGAYPDWQVMFKATYPLDDTEQKTNQRNAYFRVKQTELKKENLRKEIHDDVLNRFERVKLQHSVLFKARTGKEESEKYYNRIFYRFSRQKATSLDMKAASDTLSLARQQELEALIAFNIALLQFDLSKNEIFERFNVNVDKYINVKEQQ